MAATLHIHLLGDFRLRYNDAPVTAVNSARLQSLLAYLLLHRQAPQSRRQVAFLLWPDSTEAQARTNLRQLLHHLRRALPQPNSFIAADAQTVQWRPDAPFSLDVAEFEAALAQGKLEQAVHLYGGDLLPGCYDDWLLPERERLRAHFIQTLEQLVGRLEQERNYGRAAGYAQQLLRHDPVHERAYRRLMRLRALNGDRAGALRVYHTCVQVLQRELGVGPAPATRQAYEQLLNPASLPAAKPPHPPPPVSDSPLVSRQKEWSALQAAWRAAVQGRPHFVLISGEAGIGKSRLAEELRQWAARQGIAVAAARAYAAEGQLAYAPVAAWLRAGALKAALSGLDKVWLAEVARLLPELLAEQPTLPSSQPLTESWQKQRLFEALARAVLAGPPHRPRLLVMDDLQWCDRETLEWLRYLLRFDSRARLLVVGTTRPEESPPGHPLNRLLLDLRRDDQLAEIELRPLTQAETAQLAEQAAGRPLDPAQATRLYRETEGNPLFVVESVRAGLLENPSPPENQPLPPKVQAVIQARLARLSPEAQQLAGLAAVIGREFTFDVLAAAAGSDEDALVQGLDELWQRRIVREQENDAYDFSHDKIREAAYTGLSPARRRLLHRRVAQALERVYAANLDAASSRIAAHYEQAGLAVQAIPFYQRAATVARQIYANQKAVALLRRALSLLKTLPDTPQRAEQELALQTALGPPLVALKGYGAPEVIEVYTQARKLRRRLETGPGPPILRALAIAHLVQGQLEPPLELGRQLLNLSTQKQDPVLAVEAHYVLGVTRYWQGQFTTARQHLEQAIAGYDQANQQTHLALYAQDPQIVCLARLAMALWHLGYPEQARQHNRRAMALAQELGHPYSLAYAWHWSVWLGALRHEIARTQEQAGQSAAFSTTHGFPFWYTQDTILQGWALAQQGQAQAGLAQMQRGLADFKSTGSEIGRPYYLCLLGQVYGLLGQIEAGLQAVDEALAGINARGEGWPQAEAYRSRGQLLLTQGDQAGAGASFQQALEVARAQQARLPELQAAVALARLWQAQGRPAEARTLLAPIYGRFSEGFDTTALRQAKELLAELF